MASNCDYKSFGELLTAIMRERGFKSDEQLARRAMQIRQENTPRINVQRRTINNWRNNKSTPRSIADPQFQLVAAALKISQSEIDQFSLLIEDRDTQESRSNVNPNETVTQNRTRSITGIAVMIILLLAGATGYWSKWSDGKETYLDNIPATHLNVDKAGFVIPNSDKAVIDKKLLERLSGWELYVARNEIFARKGRIFVKSSSICLQNHFDSWAKTENRTDGWYMRKTGDISLSGVEYQNAEIIRKYECKSRGGQYNCNGQLNQCF